MVSINMCRDPRFFDIFVYKLPQILVLSHHPAVVFTQLISVELDEKVYLILKIVFKKVCAYYGILYIKRKKNDKNSESVGYQQKYISLEALYYVRYRKIKRSRHNA